MIVIVEVLILVVAGEASMKLDFLGYSPHLHAYGGLVEGSECATDRLFVRDSFTTRFCPPLIRLHEPSHRFDNMGDNACLDNKAIRKIMCRCSKRVTVLLFDLLVQRLECGCKEWRKWTRSLNGKEIE